MARREIEAAFAQHAAAQRSLAIYERNVRDVAARNLDLVRQTHDSGRGSLLDVGDVAIVLGLGWFAAVVFRDPRWFEPPRLSR
jgi:outer membrane protein TolC